MVKPQYRITYELKISTTTHTQQQQKQIKGGK